MLNQSIIKRDLEELEKYCYGYMIKNYGEKQKHLLKTRITKRGLFLYGHVVHAPVGTYRINEFINFYDSNDYKHVDYILEHLVLVSKSLKY